MIIEIDQHEVVLAGGKVRLLERADAHPHVGQLGLHRLVLVVDLLRIELLGLPHGHVTGRTDRLPRDLGPVEVAAKRIRDAHPGTQAEVFQKLGGLARFVELHIVRAADVGFDGGGQARRGRCGQRSDWRRGESCGEDEKA